MYSKVSIRSEKGRTIVFLGENEVHGVVGIEYSAKVGEIPTVSLKLIGEVELNMAEGAVEVSKNYIVGLTDKEGAK